MTWGCHGSGKHHRVLLYPFAATLRPFRLIIIIIIIIVVITIGCLKIFPDAKPFQIVSCSRPILGLFGHVGKSAKQTLGNILRNVHYIEAMGRVEDLLVLQVVENRPRFPYTQQRIYPRSLLSRRRALLPIFQKLVDFGAAPRARGSFGLVFTIE